MRQSIQQTAARALTCDSSSNDYWTLTDALGDYVSRTLGLTFGSYRRCMGTIALERRCRICGGPLGKLARSMCSPECRREGKAANGRARYERSIGRPVSFITPYSPRGTQRDGSLTDALKTGDSRRILVAVHRLSNATPDGCLLWSRDDVKGFGRFRYQGKDLRVHRVVALAIWGNVEGVVRQTCGNKLCCAPAHLLVQ